MSDLPVTHALPELLRALQHEPGSAVLVAEPGAGKTTLVPPALLHAPWCRGRVVLVEPRRLAARAAATRIAAQLGEPVGRTVGWRMRGDTRVSAGTRLEVVTDGVLTRMLHSDAALDGVDAVVFDELHERSLDTDVGLALCLDVRDALRPDLRLVAMSATIDGAVVAELLGTSTVLDVPGRNHPVGTIWIDDAPRTFDPGAVARACRRALHETDGDVLVFLPGAGEIRAVQRALEGLDREGVDVLPLHGSLPPDEQDGALAPAPAGRRKVVLSTSIAETSLTIEGIRAVVDSGWSRSARFDLRRGMGGLVTTRVSRASADQRRGRAGRTTAGRCYRMWSESDHPQLPAHDEPQIVADDLAPLALDLVRWGDPDGASLRFLDPPPVSRLEGARALLRQLEMIDDRDRLTDHGRAAAELPLHPRLAHGLLRAAELGVGAGASLVVASLAEQRRGSARGTVDLLAEVDRPDARMRQQARRLANMVDARGVVDERAAVDAAALTVGFAFPDRIARRRGTTPRYVLSGGGGAELDAHDPLARSEWLAVAELDLRAGRGDARILSAVALDATDVEQVARDLVTAQDVVEWDRQLGDVRAERQERLGAIVLSSRPIASARDVTASLLDGVRLEGLEVLPGWPSTSVYRDRVAFCRSTFGDEWPDLSDDALLATIDEWLAPWLVTARRRADLDRVDVAAALQSVVGPRLHARLDALAPTEIRLPSGRTRRLSYDSGTPVLRLRVQDAFGLAESPRVADGRVPVVLHLLSPADRPVQVTSDLAGFWRGSYAQVRVEMRGRYPKHAWPEDPTAPAPAGPA